jgi:hypothetical protein
MDDLFKIFPDLPWLPNRAAAARVPAARERDARVRQIRAAAARNSARIREMMRRRKRRGAL